MELIDNVSRRFTHSVSRAKFEVEKFQKTARIQGELNEIKKQFDSQTQELGMRAYELFRAGQISAPSISALAQALDQLQAGLVIKQEELKAAQVEVFIPAMPSTAPLSQQVPIVQEPPTTQQVPIRQEPPVQSASSKTCPICQFQMPVTSMFCASCGTRLGV